MELTSSQTSPHAQEGNETTRLVNRTRLAVLRRRVQGALQRIDRLLRELAEIRSIIRRRFIEKTVEKGLTVQIQLRPFEVKTYRNRRTEIEQQLTIARRIT